MQKQSTFLFFFLLRRTFRRPSPRSQCTCYNPLRSVAGQLECKGLSDRFQGGSRLRGAGSAGWSKSARGTSSPSAGKLGMAHAPRAALPTALGTAAERKPHHLRAQHYIAEAGKSGGARLLRKRWQATPLKDETPACQQTRTGQAAKWSPKASVRPAAWQALATAGAVGAGGQCALFLAKRGGRGPSARLSKRSVRCEGAHSAHLPAWQPLGRLCMRGWRAWCARAHPSPADPPSRWRQVAPPLRQLLASLAAASAPAANSCRRRAAASASLQLGRGAHRPTQPNRSSSSSGPCPRRSCTGVDHIAWSCAFASRCASGAVPEGC